jgi:predicted nucleotidyltransferase
MIDPRLHGIVAAQPFPLLFATLSGAHLYGFPSPDSDFDLRGAHVLPLERVVGLDVQDETIEDSRVIEALARPAEAPSGVKSSSTVEPPGETHRPEPTANGRRLEMDIVTHDVRKFFGLLLKKNGYVLEQLDAVETVPQRVTAPGQALALRLSRAADGHPPDAHR